MAKDPYQFFRTEAREILEGLGSGVLQLETGVNPELLSRLLRLAHTLKGAARIVKQVGIAEHAHAIEETLAPSRDGVTQVTRDRIDHLLARLDAIATDVAALDAPVSLASPSLPREVPVEPPAAPRADAVEMDALLDGLAEVSVQLRTLRREHAELDRARHLTESELRELVARVGRTFSANIDLIEREAAQARAAAERIRLLPASSLFAALSRTTRDVARALGKQATFEARGGDIRLDAHVLGVLQAALVQAVRNAVAHGIELDTERARAGKPPVGRVTLDVVRRGDRVAFVCADDGRGIDLEAVRSAARAKGSSQAEVDRLGKEDLVRLLLAGGLTTSLAVTEVSGRGIGLDVVRESVARLGGDVRVRTDDGRGTVLELVVPISLSSLDALIVEASGTVAAIPLHAVRATRRVAASDVALSATGDSIVHQGVVIPFVPLSRALRVRTTHARSGATCSAVVVWGGTAHAAFAVDRLRGTANVVVRSLPKLAVADRVVAGVSLDAAGDPQLVLDPDELVSSATRALVADAKTDVVMRAPILVIDDSLTTRMLEQSILESAGYEVDVATSAEEGLEKARRKRYGLFLVDVEMPKMDGFTYVATTRADPVLRETPAILVTSRNAPEDRQRGLDVGATAYIVKSEFDQVQLLSMIRKLVG